MKNMSLAAITAACNGTYHGDESLLAKKVSSVVIDSRKVEKDSLFHLILVGFTKMCDEVNTLLERAALKSMEETG